MEGAVGLPSYCVRLCVREKRFGCWRASVCLGREVRVPPPPPQSLGLVCRRGCWELELLGFHLSPEPPPPPPRPLFAPHSGSCDGQGWLRGCRLRSVSVDDGAAVVYEETEGGQADVIMLLGRRPF